MSDNGENSANDGYDIDSDIEINVTIEDEAEEIEKRLSKPECLACARYCNEKWTLLTCGHIYCRDCLVRLFETAIELGSFPPKCCEPISITSHEHILSEALVDRYTEAAMLNATHCHKENCGAFIPRREIHNGVGNCPECDAETCTNCKRAAHDGACRLDEDVEKVLELAEEMKWKRCIVCGIIVEQARGCIHMVCRCGAQFCYTCGAKWRTCLCNYIIYLEEDVD